MQGEYHIDLNIVPDVFHKMIRDIRAKKHSEYILPGGRGSMKSSTISLIIPELLKNNPNMHALILRKVGNTIKDSVYAQMKWAIDKLDLNEEFTCKVSPMEITYKPTGQKIYFRGADDPLKIKSIKPEFGYIGIVWFEELDQFSNPEEIRNIQQSAIRGGNEAYKFKSFNPPRSKNNWANEYTTEAEEKDENVMVVHSTYLDLGIEQEWLGDVFLTDAEHLKEVNPDAYENEYLGKVEISLNTSKKELSRTKRSAILIEFIRELTGVGIRTNMLSPESIMIQLEKQSISLTRFTKIKNQMNGLRMKSNEDNTMITKLLAILLSLNQSMITEIQDSRQEEQSKGREVLSIP